MTFAVFHCFHAKYSLQMIFLNKFAIVCTCTLNTVSDKINVSQTVVCEMHIVLHVLCIHLICSILNVVCVLHNIVYGRSRRSMQATNVFNRNLTILMCTA